MNEWQLHGEERIEVQMPAIEQGQKVNCDS